MNHLKLKEKIFICWRICHYALENLINAILHNSDFQRVEASWRGLRLLVLMCERHSLVSVKIKLLNISFSLLKSYLCSSVKRENSILLEKIYHQEYNHPGGEPYNLLIGDYFINVCIQSHLKLLDRLASLTALAFSPLVMGFENHDKDTTCTNSAAWRDLRLKSYTNFIGLLYPKVLMRNPYPQECVNHDADYLWGNACYDYAACAISSFIKTGSFYKLCKYAASPSFFRHDRFSLDFCEPINRKGLLQICFSKKKIKKMNKMGLILVSENELEKEIIFPVDPPIKAPSSEHVLVPLSVLLSVIRFIHCLKIMFRNKIGCFVEAEQYENYLQSWLLSYCSKHLPRFSNLKSKYPLVDAKITLSKSKDNITFYQFSVEVQPRFNFENNIKVFLNGNFMISQLDV